MTVNVHHWNEGRGVSIIHKSMCYNFRYAWGNTVKLTVIDVLDSENSIPGEIAPRVPSVVKDELKQEGFKIYE